MNQPYIPSEAPRSSEDTCRATLRSDLNTKYLQCYIHHDDEVLTTSLVSLTSTSCTVVGTIRYEPAVRHKNIFVQYYSNEGPC